MLIGIASAQHGQELDRKFWTIRVIQDQTVGHWYCFGCDEFLMAESIFLDEFLNIRIQVQADPIIRLLDLWA